MLVKKIDIHVHTSWEDDMPRFDGSNYATPEELREMYDRMGMDEEKINILGIDIPSITVPVRPGRNLAIILEIAAMNNRQKKMGINTAEEFNKRLMQQMGIES
jgi:serine kinase of HPr protein (carbohydrate metabolism regulator)